MIRPDEVIEIGAVNKTHGIHGELSVTFDDDSIDPRELRCMIFDIDGILVPFFVASARQRGNASWLVTIDDVNSDTAATALVGKTLMALRSDVDHLTEGDDDGFYIDDLIGFTMLDTDGTPVGEITDYDDSTANVLFAVKRPDGSQIFAPAAADLITDINTENKTVTIDLPVGIY